MSWLLAAAFYLITPAVTSYAAIKSSSKWNDWRVGMMAGIVAGFVTSMLLGAVFWANTSVCSQCNMGNE